MLAARCRRGGGRLGTVDTDTRADRLRRAEDIARDAVEDGPATAPYRSYCVRCDRTD